MRIPSLFSATRFVVAGTVVALFGGLLLAGLPSLAPSDDWAPAASAVASEASKLVYVLDGDVYVAEEDGTDPVRVAEADRRAGCAGLRANRGLVSPDGKHIAYRTEWSDECPGTVVVADLQGEVVASVPGSGWDIAWSPDGTRFATWLSFGDSIGIYGVDGTLQAELDGSIHSSGDHDPRWTPDGKALLLPAEVETAGITHFTVARLPLDGGAPEILPITDPLSIRSLAISPDGTRVASAGAEGQLVVAPQDGTQEGFEFYAGSGEQINAYWQTPPVWSPNGDRIAVVFSRSLTDEAGDPIQQSSSLWVVDSATGTQMTMVASLAGEGRLDPIAFSPDGERILVQRHDAAWVPDLMSVNADGSGSTVIVAGAEYGEWLLLPAEEE
jgi:Tol biopolymer transport system component